MFQAARFVWKESRSGNRAYGLSALWILFVGTRFVWFFRVDTIIRRHHRRAYEK